MGLFKTDPLVAARRAEEKATAALKAAEAKRDAIATAKLDEASGVTEARQELTTATLARAAAEAEVEQAKVEANRAAWSAMAAGFVGPDSKLLQEVAARQAAHYQKASDAGLLDASTGAEFLRVVAAIVETDKLCANIARSFAATARPMTRAGVVAVKPKRVTAPKTETVFLMRHASWVDDKALTDIHCKYQNVELPVAVAQYALQHKHAVDTTAPAAKEARSSRYTQRIPALSECVNLTPAPRDDGEG